MPHVELIELTKRFAATTAVAGLSMQIADGELLAVVGPSGCGKTTLLRLLSGLESPTSGQIRVDGRDVTPDASHRRNVAMVFQDAAIFPQLNVAENLAFGPRLQGASRDETQRRVDLAARQLGITDLLSRRATELSGGQRQRVALARAIVRKPQLLLLDEPLSQLDGPLRQELRLEVRRLHRAQGLTTIYVTHDQSEALELGQRVLLLRDGRLQQLGEPRQIYTQPANRFVAGFVGSPGMNIWPGQWDRTSGGLRVPHLGWAFTLDPSLSRRISNFPTHLQIGFRPEALKLLSGDQNSNPSQIGFAAEVESVQWLGERQLVRLCTQNIDVAVASVAADAAVVVGQTRHWRVDCDNLHFFAADGDECRLTPAAAE